jgi:hypothetical protein
MSFRLLIPYFALGWGLVLVFCVMQMNAFDVQPYIVFHFVLHMYVFGSAMEFVMGLLLATFETTLCEYLQYVAGVTKTKPTLSKVLY